MGEVGEVTRRQALKTLAGATAAVLIGGAKPGEVKAEGQVDLGKQKKEGALPIKLPRRGKDGLFDAAGHCQLDEQGTFQVTSHPSQEVKTLVSPERRLVLPKEISRDPFLRRFVVSEKKMYLLGRDIGEEGEPLFLCQYDSTTGYGQPIKVAEVGTDSTDFVFADGVVYVGKRVGGQGKIEQYTFGTDSLFHKDAKEITVEGVGQLKIIDRFIVAESQAGVLLIDRKEFGEELENSQDAEVYVSQLDHILYLRKRNIIKAWQFNQDERTPLPEIDLSGTPGEIVKIEAGENRGLAILTQEAETLAVYTKIYQQSSDNWATTSMTGIPTHEELSSQVNCRFIPICPFIQGVSWPALLVMEAYRHLDLPEGTPEIGYGIIFYDPNYNSPFYVKVALPSFIGDPNVLAGIRAAGISHLKVTQWPLVVAPEIDRFNQKTELTLYNLAVPATTYTVALPFVKR